jgi:adenine-specific DNA-methyltransferase
MTLDDNEVHRARMMLDELFGADHSVGQLTWQKRTSRKNRSALSPSIDHILVYSTAPATAWKEFRNLLTASTSTYSNPDNDPRGEWASVPFSAQGFRANQQYDITTPTGRSVRPPRGRSWGATESEFLRMRDKENRIYFPKDGDGLPRVKQFPWEAKGLVPNTLWLASEVGDTEGSKKELLQVLDTPEVERMHAPKPTALIERIVHVAATKDSFILDSFAGSGTTAHAVLKANAADNGSRRFILVEGEDYADRLTAERVRRVIRGYAWQGTQKEELLNQKLTWTQLQKADQLLARVEAIKVREGFAAGDLADQAAQASRRFDRISARVADGALVVEGERAISEHVPGLGGEFTYCTLGEPLDVEKMLSGERLPDYRALGAWLFHTATGATLPPATDGAPEWYLAEAQDRHVWLVYRPEVAFLKSTEAALTLSLARRIGQWSREHGGGKRSLVFAPAKYLSNRQLADEGVEFAALPFALYRDG